MKANGFGLYHCSMEIISNIISRTQASTCAVKHTAAPAGMRPTDRPSQTLEHFSAAELDST